MKLQKYFVLYQKEGIGIKFTVLENKEVKQIKVIGFLNDGNIVIEVGKNGIYKNE